MRRTLSLPTVFVCLLACAGCKDQTAIENEKAREEFNDAIALVDLARHQYVPNQEALAKLGDKAMYQIDEAVKAAAEAKDVRGFHDALFKQAEAKLKALADKGPNAQRVEVRQLLASLILSQARVQRLEAQAASDGTVATQGLVEAAVQSTTRIARIVGQYTNDNRPAVEKLTDVQRTSQAELAKLQGQAAALKAEIDGLTAKIAAQEAARDAAFRSSTDLRAQAFKQKDPKAAYDLHIKAIDADREGHKADREAADNKVARELAQAKAAILNKEIALTNDWLTKLDESLKSASAGNERVGELDQTLQKRVAIFVQEVEIKYGEMADVYGKQTFTKLDHAAARVNEAIDELTKAKNLNVPAKATDVALALAEANAEKLNVLEARLIASGRIGNAGETVTATLGPLLSNKRTAIEASLNDSKKRHEEATTAAQATAGGLIKMLGESPLSGIKAGDGADAMTVNRAKLLGTLRQQATTYESRTDAFKILPAVERAAALARLAANRPAAPAPVDPGAPEPPAPAPAAPGAGDASPQATVAAVVAGLAADNPAPIWQALPPSYQKQIEDLIHEAAGKMDAELWNKSFGVAKKLVKVLAEKKQYILDHPMMAQNVPAEMKQSLAAGWDDVVKLISILVNSELADLDKLKTLKVETFLAGTGASFMKQMSVVAALAPGNPLAEMKAKLKATAFEYEKQDDGSYLVKADGDPQKFVQVEGKWLPDDMVAQFPAAMQQAKAQLAALDPAALAQNKPAMMAQLALIDGVLTNLDKAQSADEFNQAFAPLEAIINAMMAGGGAKPPGE